MFEAPEPGGTPGPMRGALIPSFLLAPLTTVMFAELMRLKPKTNKTYNFLHDKLHTSRFPVLFVVEFCLIETALFSDVLGCWPHHKVVLDV